jgi:hypothetical protein
MTEPHVQSALTKFHQAKKDWVHHISGLFLKASLFQNRTRKAWKITALLTPLCGTSPSWGRTPSSRTRGTHSTLMPPPPPSTWHHSTLTPPPPPSTCRGGGRIMYSRRQQGEYGILWNTATLIRWGCLSLSTDHKKTTATTTMVHISSFEICSLSNNLKESSYCKNPQSTLVGRTYCIRAN